MNQIYTTAIIFNLVLSFGISLIVFLFGEIILIVMNVPEVMMKDAVVFMKIVGGFLFINAVFDTFSQIFRSNGKTYIGMFISLGMNVLNIGGNYMFLYGPLSYLKLGVIGTAISTSVSRCIGLIIAMIFFKFTIRGSFSFKTLNPFPWDILKKLLKLGIPTAGENISYNMSQTAISMIVNSMGVIAITTRIYSNIICSFSYLFTVSIAVATGIMVGNAVGAKDYEFAEKRVFKTLKSGMAVSVSLTIINVFLYSFTFGLFTQNIKILQLGKQILIIAIILEVGRTINIIVINSLKASGDVFFPTVLGVSSMWFFSVGIGFLLGIVFDFGLIGIWIGMAFDEVFRGLVVFERWRKGKWKEKRLIVEEACS